VVSAAGPTVMSARGAPAAAAGAQSASTATRGSAPRCARITRAG
jgi:hypothetical protein